MGLINEECVRIYFSESPKCQGNYLTKHLWESRDPVTEMTRSICTFPPSFTAEHVLYTGTTKTNVKDLVYFVVSKGILWLVIEPTGLWIQQIQCQPFFLWKILINLHTWLVKKKTTTKNLLVLLYSRSTLCSGNSWLINSTHYIML